MTSATLIYSPPLLNEIPPPKKRPKTSLLYYCRKFFSCRVKAATLVVIILYRMGAFHLLGQIVHGLSKRKPKFRTSKFLSRNRVYHLHKSGPLTEKRPRKPETVIKDRFDRYIFRCFVAPGNFTRERPVNSCSMYIFGKWKAPSVSQILLKKKGKLLGKRKSIADLQNGGNF